ncbi:hypothetical protein Tco_0543532 [Tanacetum coccineum]
MKDKVVPNTSHVKFKKTEVEEHPRISNQTKSVTACNDNLNSKTLNVKDVCATCGKCVFNVNHDACVSKFLKDVNARTKKPNGVPINLEVAFRKSTCFVRDLQGNDLLTESPTSSEVMAQRLSQYLTSTTLTAFKEKSVNKSSSPTDNFIQKDTPHSMNIQPLSEPSTPTNVHAEENNDHQAEFTNPFCTPVQETVEFILTQYLKSIQASANQTTTCNNRAMSMFPLTVSIVELEKHSGIMADSAWIEAIQEEIHQFDGL